MDLLPHVVPEPVDHLALVFLVHPEEGGRGVVARSQGDQVVFHQGKNLGVLESKPSIINKLRLFLTWNFKTQVNLRVEVLINSALLYVAIVVEVLHFSGCSTTFSIIVVVAQLIVVVTHI